MKVFIPAAGTGSRLWPLTANRPKTMLEINGHPIIHYLVSGLISNGLDDIVIVSGYQQQIMVNYLEKAFPAAGLKIIHNDKYDTMNNIYSLHLAEPYLKGSDILIINSDVFCESALLQKAILAPLDTMIIDSHAAYTREATKIDLDPSGFISRISKELAAGESKGEYIGIMKLSRHSASALFTRTKAFIEDDNTQVWFVYALNEILDQVELKPVFTEGLAWEEIDFIHDYRRALALAQIPEKTF